LRDPDVDKLSGPVDLADESVVPPGKPDEVWQVCRDTGRTADEFVWGVPV
jgi:hypothetical protein